MSSQSASCIIDDQDDTARDNTILDPFIVISGAQTLGLRVFFNNFMDF